MLKSLCEIPSPSGGEEKIKEFIINELSGYTDLYFEDSFGNLIFLKNGNGGRLCFECGIDEPFLMVSDTFEDKIRFTAPPHIKASVFTGKDVCFADGKSVFTESEKEENEKEKVSDLYAEAKEERKTGECATLLPCFKMDSDSVAAFNIKYKIPCLILMNVIKEIKESSVEAYFVFSVQRCLAARGVRASMQSGISFDRVISVSCIEESSDGIKVMAKEKSCVLSPEIRKELLSLARENGIFANAGFSDESFNMKLYLTEGEGAPCGLVCVPCSENKVNINDIEAAEKLLAAVCEG